MATRDPSVYLASLSLVFSLHTHTNIHTLTLVNAPFPLHSSRNFSLVLFPCLSSYMYTIPILLRSLFLTRERLFPFSFFPPDSLSLSLYFIPFLPFSFFIFLTLILAHVTSNSLFSSLFPVFAYFSHPVFSPLSIFLCSFTLRPLFHLSFEHVSHIFAFPSSPLYSTDSLFRSSSHFSPFFRSPFLPLFCPRRRKPNARSFIF